MTTFGERLRDAITASGASVEWLATACKVSDKTVICWLSMREAYLSGLHLGRAGMALRISMRWLALGSGDPRPIRLEEARTSRETM